MPGAYDDTLGVANAVFSDMKTYGCAMTKKKDEEECCGCACLFCRYGADGDLTRCEGRGESCDPPYGATDDGGDSLLQRRKPKISESSKKVANFCGAVAKSLGYPGFPAVGNKKKNNYEVWETEYPEIEGYYSYNTDDCADWSCKKRDKPRNHGGTEIGYQSKSIRI